MREIGWLLLVAALVLVVLAAAGYAIVLVGEALT